MIQRKTKIVCTLGPSTEDDAVLRELMLSGMNVARLNFSHGNHEYHLNNMQRIRRISKELGKHVGIMLIPAARRSVWSCLKTTRWN